MTDRNSGRLSAKALRFQAILDQHVPDARVVEFNEPARTAQQAADAIGCQLDQIVKSLVFRTGDDRAPEHPSSGNGDSVTTGCSLLPLIESNSD